MPASAVDAPEPTVPSMPQYDPGSIEVPTVDAEVVQVDAEEPVAEAGPVTVEVVEGTPAAGVSVEVHDEDAAEAAGVDGILLEISPAPAEAVEPEAAPGVADPAPADPSTSQPGEVEPAPGVEPVPTESATADPAPTDEPENEVASDPAAEIDVATVETTANGAEGGADDDTVVEVSIDYAEFAQAYGGDWASRLRVVSLPDCALTRAVLSRCRTQEPLESVNDVEAQTVTATLSARSTGVVALAAAAESSTGSWKATSLSPSSSWQVSEQTGDFAWSYPLRVPPGVNGPEPDLSLSYSAGSLDGKVSTTNNQTSWVGDGWDLSSGFIERRYVGCADDQTNGNNASRKTGDLCWKSENATLSFSGHSGELVKDADSDVWRLKNDDGTRVERRTGGWNGDDDGEYWVVTTTDGTTYYFGRGKRSADDTLELNSAWTVPVFGNQAGEPCYKADFASAWCQQAWRWNLEYVVDTSGNSATFVYAKETNKYGRNLDDAVSSYVRGGHLARIEYGQRAGSESDSNATGRVVFAVAERCLPKDGVTCAADTLTNDTAKSWPDVPFDQICTSETTCASQLSPAFFTRKRLTSVTTQVRSGSEWQDVDRWTLTHTYPDPGDSTSPALWLSKISHQGLVGGTITLPDVTFAGVQMGNRVDTLGDAGPAMNRYRISSIATESGATTSLNYSAPDCTPTSLPASQDSNTRRCFPVRWHPEGSGEEIVEYFHKYVVETVAEGAGEGIPAVETAYTYVGSPAWAYDDNPLVPEKERTWSEWRGYGTVDVTTGTATESVRGLTRMRFFRGMHGDKIAAGGTRSVQVDGITDHERLSGVLRETITYNGVGGAEVEGTVTTPWISAPTATAADGTKATYSGPATVEARLTASKLTGGKRVTRTVTTYDDTWGLPVRVDDQGDVSTAADDRCTRIEYVRNTAAHLVATSSRSETVGVACATTPERPADVISDVRTSFDGKPFGATPTRGLVTAADTLKAYDGSTPVYVTTRSTFDAYGRPTSVTDALGRTTTTAYTPATGGPLRSTTTTSPDPDGSGPLTASTSTTEVAPAWGAPVKETDPNGKVTTATYDALGRTTAVWFPGRTQGTDTASQVHTYALSRNGVNAVTSKTIDAHGEYLTAVEIYDGLLRARQSQQEARTAEGTGRLVASTTYDSRGLAVMSDSPWYTSGAPSGTVVAPQVEMPMRTGIVYDGAGRTSAEVTYVTNVERWRTTTTYDGDRVTVDPPTGAVATTVVTDARGNITERHQYVGDAPTGTPRISKYTYDRAGRMTSNTDPGGNVWSYTHDLLGRQVASNDPDKGATTSVYDDAGQLVSTTDARGITITHVRDTLGRELERRQGSATGTLLASWTYDTLAKGQLTSSTRHVGTAKYTTAVTGYDDRYQPLGQSVTLPSTEGALAGTHAVTYSYAPDGQLASTLYPATAGLPPENLRTAFDDMSRPRALTSGAYGVYVADTKYLVTGQMMAQDLGASRSFWVLNEYETGTNRLTRTSLSREGVAQLDVNRTYTYDDAGNPTSIIDRPGGKPVDAQCFTYNGLRRLTVAWTPANANCSVAPSASALGGPAPYWTSYSYNAVANRTQEVQRTATTTTTNTYTYPASGATSVRPHAVTGISSVTGTTTKTGTYTYDASGNTTARTPAGGTAQTLTWDAEQRLTTVKQGTATVGAYIYTADGERLVRKQSGKTTVYLPGGQELTLTTATGAVTGQRYYSFAGKTVATRTGTALSTISILVSDTQGTATATIADTANTIQFRRTDPFGNLRGTKPTTWPGDHLFLDKVLDATGLTQVGARYYDATIGRFISVDPVMDIAEPDQWAAYTYANNNPITFSDPTGLWSGPIGDWPKGPGSSSPQAIKQNTEKAQARQDVGGGSGPSGRRTGTANAHRPGAPATAVGNSAGGLSVGMQWAPVDWHSVGVATLVGMGFGLLVAAVGVGVCIATVACGAAVLVGGGVVISGAAVVSASAATASASGVLFGGIDVVLQQQQGGGGVSVGQSSSVAGTPTAELAALRGSATEVGPNGYHSLGRALQKKLGRTDEMAWWRAWRPAKGDPAGYNRSGEDFYDFLMNHPGTRVTIEQGRSGNPAQWGPLRVYRLPTGQGASFDQAGKFVGLRS